MASASIDVLGSFKVNQWYKLAIYLGAVLLILTFVLAGNSNTAKYTSFAVKSLVLGLIVWITDDTLYAYGSAKIEEEHYNKLEKAKNIAAVVWAVRWVGLLVWIWIVVTSI